MASRLRITWRRMRHRLCGLLVLLGVCASLLPIPLASPKPTEKDSSQPFPCQNRPCGCRSAEQCWKKCCCFTNSQKLAWAKTHRVVAPNYVHVAAANESKAVTCQRACCAKKIAPKSCCHSGADAPECGSDRQTVQHSDATHGIDYVIGVFADECRGHSSFWNSLPWAVIPGSVAMEVCSETDGIHAILVCVLPVVSYQPLAPPPRRSSVSTRMI